MEYLNSTILDFCKTSLELLKKIAILIHVEFPVSDRVLKLLFFESRRFISEAGMNKFLSTILLVALAVFSMLMLVYFSRKEPVIVALSTSLKSGNIVGSSEINTFNLFLERNPYTLINLEMINDHWEPEIAKEEISKAVSRKIKFFITAHPSSSAVSTASLFKDGKALKIVTASTTNVLTGKDDYIIRMIPDVTEEQRSIASYLNNMKPDKILIIQDSGNTAYTDPAFEVVSEVINSQEDKEIIHELINVSEFSPSEVNKLFLQDYDILYILAGSYQAAIGNIAQMSYIHKPDVSIMLTPWARTPSILESAGPAIYNMILPSQYPSRYDDGSIDYFFKEYFRKFGHNPVSMSIGVYQSLEILNEAFINGHKTPEKVKRYITGKKKFNTLIGDVIFDEFGDRKMDFHYLTDLIREFE